MTPQDIEKLKALCEKEGVELNSSRHDTFWITIKDVWQGVEFIEITVDSNGKITEGKIYPIQSMANDHLLIRNDLGESGGYVSKSSAKPSIESAYVEQLKAKAKELFGDIRKGDVFDQSPFNEDKGKFKIERDQTKFTYD